MGKTDQALEQERALLSLFQSLTDRQKNILLEIAEILSELPKTIETKTNNEPE